MPGRSNKNARRVLLHVAGVNARKTVATEIRCDVLLQCSRPAS